jgi:hypothetical protein
VLVDQAATRYTVLRRIRLPLVCLFVVCSFEEKEDRSVGVGGEGALTNDPQARRGLCQAMYLRSRETASGTPAANDQLKDRGAAQEYSHTLLRGDWMLLGCRRSLWVRAGAGAGCWVLVAVVAANSNVFLGSHHREEAADCVKPRAQFVGRDRE